MTPFGAFAWGAFGNAALAVADLHSAYARNAGELPARYRSAGFWVTRTALAVVGGGLAVAAHLTYGVESIVLAINVGVSTPLILERLGGGIDPALGHLPGLPGPSPRLPQNDARSTPTLPARATRRRKQAEPEP